MIRAEILSTGDPFTAADRGATAATRVALSNSGAMLLTRIRANASSGHHRPGLPHIPGTGPGPNVATGDYRRSWHTRELPDGTVMVSTNAPQARRLEYGFFGVDSRGRAARSPQYPHVRPAVEQTRPYMAEQLKSALAREVS